MDLLRPINQSPALLLLLYGKVNDNKKKYSKFLISKFRRENELLENTRMPVNNSWKLITNPALKS